MKLTANQIDDFHEHGFLVVHDVLSAEVLDPLIADFEELIDDLAGELVTAGRLRSVHADEPFSLRLAHLTWEARESLQNRISFPANHRQAVYDFLLCPALVDLVASIVGGEVHCHPSQHVRPKLPAFIATSFPDFSMRSPVHQDAAGLLPEADGTPVLTTWIPLVDVDVEMGPVEVYPGMHRGGILPHVHRPGRGLMIADEARPEVEAVKIPMAKGGVLLMHGRTPHRSGHNHTQLVRRSLDLRWNDPRLPHGRPLPGLIARSDEAAVTSYDQWLEAWSRVVPTQVPRIVDRWAPG